MAINEELEEKIVFLLKNIADLRNWDFDKEYGPFGSFAVNKWLDREDIWDTAQDILNELNKE